MFQTVAGSRVNRRQVTAESGVPLIPCGQELVPTGTHFGISLNGGLNSRGYTRANIGLVLCFTRHRRFNVFVSGSLDRGRCPQAGGNAQHAQPAAEPI